MIFPHGRKDQIMANESIMKVLESLGIRTAGADAAPVHVDLTVPELVEHALAAGEGKLLDNGALSVETGERTGRSPKDRFIVDTPDVHDTIAWGGVNVPIARESFESVRDGIAGHFAERPLYVVRGLAGADRRHARKFLIVCERASQALFIKQLLVRPTDEELETYGAPDFTVLAAPDYKTDPERDGVHSDATVIINFEDRMTVIAGTGYSGEIKKSVFSVMNYLLPVEDKVLSMHCSANVDPESGKSAVYFGLSGTGKTSLSATITRQLIGDDEHGWALGDSVFNIEGGCYAKCDGLTEEREPEIYRAVRFGALTENVVSDAKRHPDYFDLSLTQNTRVGYPVEYIPNCNPAGTGPEPSIVFFLTCDAFGVLPPIARLTREAAMYHFVTGFTSKVAGTEQGIVDPVPTFSALFGEPFMPLDPMVYADMLAERMDRSGAKVYLVNTGWVGGGYGVGNRIPIQYNHASIAAAYDGALDNVEYVHDDIFNLDVPVECPGVPTEMMDQRSFWADPEAYDASARKLAGMFEENFARRFPNLPDEVRDAGPHA